MWEVKVGRHHPISYSMVKTKSDPWPQNTPFCVSVGYYSLSHYTPLCLSVFLSVSICLSVSLCLSLLHSLSFPFSSSTCCTSTSRATFYPDRDMRGKTRMGLLCAADGMTDKHQFMPWKMIRKAEGSQSQKKLYSKWREQEDSVRGLPMAYQPNYREVGPWQSNKTMFLLRW